MTRKTEDKSVLPLMGDNNIPVFDSRNKTEMLREIFFGGKHIKHDSFDKDFCSDGSSPFLQPMFIITSIAFMKISSAFLKNSE
jgi:hypothetical protein